MHMTGMLNQLLSVTELEGPSPADIIKWQAECRLARID